jgi:hypothetical protein
MASLISLMVKSGSSKALPYVSSRTPWDSFRICSSTELRDERDVDEADWAGESSGVATVEFVEATDCWVVFLLRFGFEPESAVVDMIANGFDVTWKRTAQSKVLKKVAICFFPAIVDPQLAVGRIRFVGTGASATWNLSE